MTRYAAFLRGIGPSNPNMRNEKLAWLFRSLSFTNVRTVISSGNVIFESNSKDAKALEAKIEKALPKKLGFSSTTIVRSSEELQKLADKDPFKGYKDTAKSKLNVTFLKSEPATKMKFPYRVDNREYFLLGVHYNAAFSVIDLTGSKTPDLMTWLDKKFGKEITTRTWKTVNKVLVRMEK